MNNYYLNSITLESLSKEHQRRFGYYQPVKKSSFQSPDQIIKAACIELNILDAAYQKEMARINRPRRVIKAIAKPISFWQRIIKLFCK